MKLGPDNRTRLVIYATFVVALVLSILPMPDWAEPFRPDWVSLVLIYWCMALPNRVGVGTGWVLGLLLDVLYGSLLGQHALAKAVIAYITLRLHLQLRMFPIIQQALSVLLLLALNQLLIVWIMNLSERAPQGISYWTPIIVGMAIWPWLFVILRDVRRRGKLS